MELVTDTSLSSVGWSSSRLEHLLTGTPSYSKLGTDLLTFCIGLVRNPHPKYIRDLPDNQKSAIKAYIRALRSQQTPTQDTLQELLYLLFTEEVMTTVERYKTTVYRFLILYSFQADGNISWCSTITQHISKLVFFGRCAIYRRIQRGMKKCERGFYL